MMPVRFVNFCHLARRIIGAREVWNTVAEHRPEQNGCNVTGDSFGPGQGGHALRFRRDLRSSLICQSNVSSACSE